MIRRILELIVFGFLFVVLFWFGERSKNTDRAVYRSKMRFWVGFATWMACAEFASNWHSEIGAMWQNHPDLALFGTLIVFAMLGAVAPSLNSLLTAFPDGSRQHSHSRVP